MNNQTAPVATEVHPPSQTFKGGIKTLLTYCERNDAVIKILLDRITQLETNYQNLIDN